MSQNHFLTQTYEKVIGDTNYKSQYRTLNEAYTSIHEEAQEGIRIDVTKPILNVVPWTPVQQNLYNLTASKQIETTSDYPELEEEKSGAGPGELAVASVITGITDPNQCLKLISGQNKSYDVSWPTKEHPEYTFEVKMIEEGSVRIAKHGANFTKKFFSEVKHVLNDILDEYDLLSEEDKTYINNYIVSHLPEVKEPGKRAVKGRAQYDKLMLRRTSWSIEKWVKGILSDTKEFPFSLIYSDKEPALTRGGIRVLMSVKTFGTIINNIEENEQVEAGEEPSDHKSQEDNPRVAALKKTFKSYYSAPNSEKASALDQEIEKTAKIVDKKLSKAKVHITGEGESSWREFFKSVSKLNILDKVNDIQEMIKSPESIKSLFPSHLTGLFVVSPAGYIYVPHNDLEKYITIATISLGGPKIAIKHPNANVQTIPTGKEY
jgi:hypothetical protein